MTIPLGISLMPHGPVADLVGLARLAENLGCSRCWVYDEGLATRDVYVAKTAVGESGSRNERDSRAIQRSASVVTNIVDQTIVNSRPCVLAANRKELT